MRIKQSIQKPNQYMFHVFLCKEENRTMWNAIVIFFQKCLMSNKKKKKREETSYLCFVQYCNF
ncbi:unnamed protein product [Brassica oleracea var. botrytis]